MLIHQRTRQPAVRVARRGTLVAVALSLALAAWLGSGGNIGRCAAAKPEGLSPAFSVESGIFTNNLRVKVSSPGSGTIHYTLDGTEPTSASPKFAGQLGVTN